MRVQDNKPTSAALKPEARRPRAHHAAALDYQHLSIEEIASARLDGLRGELVKLDIIDHALITSTSLNTLLLDSNTLAIDVYGRVLPALGSKVSAIGPATDALAELADSLAERLVHSGLTADAVQLLRGLAMVDLEVQNLKGLEASVSAAGQQAVAVSAAEPPVDDPFELLTVSKLANALGISDETVRNWEKDGQLFSFMGPGRKRGKSYPAFQAMKQVVGEPLAKVLAVLKGLNGASIYQFFSSPSPELARLSPVEVMMGKLAVPRLMNNDGLAILQGAGEARLAATLGAARTFHADASA